VDPSLDEGVTRRIRRERRKKNWFITDFRGTIGGYFTASLLFFMTLQNSDLSENTRCDSIFSLQATACDAECNG
jgi:hypothetical protein